MKPLSKKELKIETEKQALSERITDMLAGATGGTLEDDGEGDICSIASTDLEGFSNWLQAMKRQLVIGDPKVLSDSWTDHNHRNSTFNINYLGKFEFINSATEFLYEQGFRAE